MTDDRPTVLLCHLPDRPEIVTPDRLLYNPDLADELAAHNGFAGREELWNAIALLRVEDEYRIADGHAITPLYMDDGMQERVMVYGQFYIIILIGAYAEVFDDSSARGVPGQRVARLRWDGRDVTVPPSLDDNLSPWFRKVVLDRLAWMSDWPDCGLTGRKAVWTTRDGQSLTIIGKRPSTPHTLTVYEVLDDAKLERIKVKPSKLTVFPEIEAAHRGRMPRPAGPVTEHGGWMVF